MERRRRTVVRKRTIGLPAELSRVNLNTAGIDVGASSHFVAVSEASAEECVRDHALTVTGGAVTGASRKNSGDNREWIIMPHISATPPRFSSAP